MNFSTLDLNLLRVLDALLHEGSTAKAGQRIGLSQPAVSAALKRLRHALGDPLFVRRGQGIEPTDFAEGLKGPLRSHLDGLQTLLDAGRAFDPAAATDTFKLSGSDYFAEMLMPELADLLSRRAPLMRVQLVDLVPDGHIDTLDRYEVDIAMIPEMEFPPWVRTQHLLWAQFSVIARNGNRRIARLGVTPGDEIPLDPFCDMGHVLFSPEGNFKGMGDMALAKVGRERRVVMTSPYFNGVARAVSRSELIALVPTVFAERVATYLPLSLYAAPIPLPVTEVLMVWHQRSTANPAHRWLRDQIAEVLAPYAGADLMTEGDD